MKKLLFIAALLLGITGYTQNTVTVGEGVTTITITDSVNSAYGVLDSLKLGGTVADGIVASTAFTGNLASSATGADTIFSTVLHATQLNYAADAEASDAYVVSIPFISTYTNGLQVTFLANTANTAAATLKVNALAAITIKKLRDQDLATGDIEAAQIVSVVYDGTNFQMTSQLAQ